MAGGREEEREERGKRGGREEEKRSKKSIPHTFWFGGRRERGLSRFTGLRGIKGEGRGDSIVGDKGREVYEMKE